jgi:MFS family permease
VRDVIGDRRVLRLAAIWLLTAALDEPFFGFLIANLEGTRRVSTATATALVVSVVVGGMATYAALAVMRRRFSGRARFIAGSLGLLATTVIVVGAPWTAVIALAGVGFGAASALLWVALQSTTLRLRPGQVGTTQAVISGLATAGIVIPPLIGVAADRLGLGAAMWLIVLAPAAVVVLVLTDKGRDRSVRSLCPWVMSSSR